MRINLLNKPVICVTHNVDVILQKLSQETEFLDGCLQ